MNSCPCVHNPLLSSDGCGGKVAQPALLPDHACRWNLHVTPEARDSPLGHGLPLGQNLVLSIMCRVPVEGGGEEADPVATCPPAAVQPGQPQWARLSFRAAPGDRQALCDTGCRLPGYGPERQQGGGGGGLHTSLPYEDGGNWTAHRTALQRWRRLLPGKLGVSSRSLQRHRSIPVPLPGSQGPAPLLWKEQDVSLALEKQPSSAPEEPLVPCTVGV